MANKEMSRRRFLDLGAKSLLALSVAPYLPNISATRETEKLASEWEQFKPGDQVFAVANGPTELYSAPEAGAPVTRNLVMDTYEGEAGEILYSPRHMIERETTLRLRMVDREWGQILKQEGTFSPFVKYPDSSGKYPKEHFVKLEYFAPLKQLEPISVLPNTKPEDKEIVIVQYPAPQLLLIEQRQIVASIPVILGAGKTPTPKGDFQASLARITDFMPGFPGVGFCLEIVEGPGIYLHNAAWWIWKNIKEGRYGSHGCVNLPDVRWENAVINGKNVSMAQFIFQWALTNFPFYDQFKDEYIHVGRNDPGFDKLLPVHVMGAIDALKWTPRKAEHWGWQDILAKYRTLGKREWIIPSVGDRK